VLATNDKYALPLLLTMLALAKELIKARIIKPKKPANKIDQLIKELQKLSILSIT
jgi:hypothetical protein